ncbi:MAG: Ig-like domain repeat protein [Acidobacteria bacterium]|nr:Ig-like domain repeat protein [Acidobacteriota bacterium]
MRFLGAVLALSMEVGIAPAQAVYVPNFTTSNVSGYLIDPATGALDRVAGSPFTTGQSPVQAAIHPAGKFLYVLDAGAGDITLFEISAPSGTLRVLPCIHCEAQSPSGMTIDPTGQYLFVTSSGAGTVTPYSINLATGQLTKGPAASTGAGSRPVQAAVDPSGRYLYVANSATGQVAGFSIQGGALTPLDGSPYAAGSGPSGVAASRTAVYVSNLYSADISVYRIAAGGVLVSAGPTIPAGGGVTSIAVDPTGNFIYATNQSQTLAFNTATNGPFPLTFVQALNGGTTPSFVATSPDGNYVYVANATSNDVNGFAISAGGTLISAGAASTFGTAGQRAFTVQHIGETTSIALSSGYPAPSGPSYGTPVQVKGVVSNTRNPGIVPQGSITVRINGAPAPNGTVPLDAGGGFSLWFDGTTQFLAAGASIVKIAYNPAAGFEAPAPLAILETVAKAAPAFTISTSPTPAVTGQPVSIAAWAPMVGSEFPSGTVTISVDGVPVGTAPLVSGRAQLSYTPATGNHSITGSYGGDGLYLSMNVGPVAFHANQPTSTTVTSTASAVVYGQAVTFTASVTAGGSVGGTVDFFDNGLKINPSPVAISAGRAQFGPYAPSSVGTHAITAKYSGDPNSLPSDNSAAPLIETVNPAQTSVTPPVASGALVYGQPSTFTVTVAAVSPGSGNPSGAVTFKDGNSILGTATLVAGVAGFTSANLAAGSHTITAEYAGDASFLSATSVAAVSTIGRAAPTMNVSARPQGPLVFGQQVSLNAALSGNGAISGTVDFTAGGLPIGSATVSGGIATLLYRPVSVGPIGITAVYQGDANNLPATATLSGGVNQAAVTITLSASPGTAVVGQPVAFSVSVAAAPPGAGIPTGVVDFQDGSATLGSANLASGAATFTTSQLALGQRPIVASYRGDANFVAGGSPPVSVLVVKAVPSVSVGADNANVVLGNPVTLTATISGNPGLPVAGTVDWFDNGTKISAAPAPINGNVAQFGPYIFTRAGGHSITAVYSGDGTYGPANSANVLTIVVSQAVVTVAPPSLSGSPTYGTSASFAVAVSASTAVAGAPGGTVVLKEGATTLASAPLSNGGATLVANSALTAGTHVLTAVYSGDQNFLTGTSAPAAISIAKARPALSLSLVSEPNPVVGQAITVKAILDGGAAATGAIDLFDSGMKLNSAPLGIGNGSALSTLSLTSAGVHSLIAEYGGDLNFQGASSAAAPLSIAVAKSPSAATLLMDSGVTTFGRTVSVLATVLPAGAGRGVPTGTVRLSGSAGTSATAILAGGQAAVPATLAAAGSQTLRISYDGDLNFAPSTSIPLAIIVEREATNTLLTVLQSSTATTLTARVSSTVPFVPTGTVRFMSGGSTLATASLDSAGVATTVLPPATTGAITAVYSGDTNFSASTSAGTTLTTTPRSATGLTLRIDPANAIAGQAITCTVTLNASGPATPSGRIELFDGAILLSSLPAGKQAVFTVNLAAGNHNLTASYTGDPGYEPAFATSAFTVGRIASVLALTAGSTAPNAGDALTLTARLETPSVKVAFEPGGRVDFLDGNTVIGSAALVNRSSTLVLARLAPGPHQFSCVYSGDINWNGATSNAIAISADKTPTIVEIRALPSASDDQQTTVTANVTTVPSGLGTPSGTVQFYDLGAGKVLSTVPLTGATATASIPNILKPAGIIALYDGDARFQAGSSAPAGQFSVTNAASYATRAVAPDSIVTVFAPALSDSGFNADLPLPASLGGVSVTLVDGQSVSRDAALFYVTPAQLSFLVPAEMPPGPASLRVNAANGAAMTAVIDIGPVSPGLFTANGNGRGVAAAQTVQVRAGEQPQAPRNVATYDEAAGAWIGEPIALAPGVQTYLILYGTGIRGRSDVLVELNGQLLPVLFSGAQSVYPGLDQINVLIPPDLRLDGLATVTVSAGGERSNAAELMFQSALADASPDAGKF